LLRTTDLLFSR